VAQIHAAGVEQRLRPRAARDVEPQRAGGVRGVARVFAAQAQAQPVLGQQHLRRRGEHVGLVRAHPQHLGRGEPGHRAVAGDLFERRDRARERFAFGAAAAVVPEDGRPQHAIVCTEEHGAMHLPGRPERAHRRHRLRVGVAQAQQRAIERGPPVVGMLLAPQRPLAADRERLRGAADDAMRVVEQQRLQLRGAEVDAEKHPSAHRRSGGRIATGTRSGSCP
jgi:hypothetical protein